MFVDDLSSVGGFSRVLPRHTAAAPTVDILLKRRRPFWFPEEFLAGVSNGIGGSVEVFPGRWRATVFPTGSDDAVLGPSPVRLRSNNVYIVYVVGSLANESLEYLVVEIDP